MPNSFFFGEPHRMPSCERESSLPPDELGDFVCFSGFTRCSHRVRCGGCIVLVWIYCPLCMRVCSSACLCVCAYPVRADSEALPLPQMGRGKPTGWTICLLNVCRLRVHVSCDFFFSWMERYCLFKHCDLAKSNLPKYTHTHTHTHKNTQTVDLCSGWLNRLGNGKLGGCRRGRQWGPWYLV